MIPLASLVALLLGLIGGITAQPLRDPRTIERKLFGNALDIDHDMSSRTLATTEDEYMSHRQLSPLVLRGLTEIVTEFRECQHKGVQECKDIIENEYARNPARFGGPGQTFTYDVRKKRLRGDWNYYWVSGIFVKKIGLILHAREMRYIRRHAGNQWLHPLSSLQLLNFF